MHKNNSILGVSIILNVILSSVLVFSNIQKAGKNEENIKDQAKKETEAQSDVKTDEPESYNIVMFGNSLTAGGNWSEDLSRTDIKNSGNGGFTTSHFVWILNGQVTKFKPKLCFIEGGINDIGVGIPMKRTFRNYTSIIDTLLKHNIEPIIQSTFYVNLPNDSLTFIYNSKVDSLNTFISTLAKEKGVIFLDMNEHLSENRLLKKELNKDGIHLNELGYKVWTKEIVKILKVKGI